MGKLNGRLTAGLIIIVIFAVLGLLLPRFVPTDPRALNTFRPNLQPSNAHILGTTGLGQDTFWYLCLAIQNSLLIGLIVAIFSTAIGVLVGLAAGFLGGIFDRVLTLL